MEWRCPQCSSSVGHGRARAADAAAVSLLGASRNGEERHSKEIPETSAIPETSGVQEVYHWGLSVIFFGTLRLAEILRNLQGETTQPPTAKVRSLPSKASVFTEGPYWRCPQCSSSVGHGRARAADAAAVSLLGASGNGEERHSKEIPETSAIPETSGVQEVFRWGASVIFLWSLHLVAILQNLQGETTQAPTAEVRSLPSKASVFREGPYVYRMSGKPRGQCIIINNRDFIDGYKTRHGSEIDVCRMAELFYSFHFDVRIWFDLSAAEMKKLLLKTAENQSESSDCLVVIIMSHGECGKIEGVDGESIDLMEDVYSRFNNAKCPALQGKPKVFFIQACRGHNYDNGIPAVVRRADADSAVQESPGTASTCQVSEKFAKRLPSLSDMFIANATIPGHVALRHPEEGSWFIFAVYEVFRMQASTMHLQTMMNLVEAAVMEKASHDGSRQTASSTTLGWAKKLYFNIGHFRDRV